MCSRSQGEPGRRGRCQAPPPTETAAICWSPGSWRTIGCAGRSTSGSPAAACSTARSSAGTRACCARPAASTGGPTARADRRKTCTGSNSPPTAPPARALSPTSSVSATGRCSRSAKRCRAGCRSLVRVRHTPPETAQDWRPRRGEGRTRPHPLRPGLSRRCLVPLAGGPDRHLRPLIPGAASREKASSTACRSSPPTSAGLRPCHPAGSEVGPAIAARDILA